MFLGVPARILYSTSLIGADDENRRMGIGARMAPALIFVMPLVLASLTLASTGLGGLTALRFCDRLHLLLAFSSGAVIAVARYVARSLCDGGGSSHMLLTAIGFPGFLALEPSTAMHRDRHAPMTAPEQELGSLSAGGLVWAQLSRRRGHRSRLSLVCRHYSPRESAWNAATVARLFCRVVSLYWSFGPSAGSQRTRLTTWWVWLPGAV
jgi:hypothetical protein